MSKALLISIKPKWVAKILNGEKTIEVRKSKPNVELPIDVYIYCTKDSKTKLSSNSLQYYVVDNKDYREYLGNCNSKVVAKFTLNKVVEITNRYCKGMLIDSCLTNYELNKYLGNNIGYAWHISNLVILDKPKELSEFKICCREKFCHCYYGKCMNCSHLVYEDENFCDKRLTKAPQSWQFIETGE